MFTRRFILTAGLSILALALSSIGAAQSLVGRRTALRGYDPVSYFSPGHAERGSEQFTAPFDDATYWFKSADHRALFVADPERYAPRYRGYCAVSMSHGRKIEANPEVWAIINDRLYVFGSADGKTAFHGDSQAIERANANWSELGKTR